MALDFTNKTPSNMEHVSWKSKSDIKEIITDRETFSMDSQAPNGYILNVESKDGDPLFARKVTDVSPKLCNGTIESITRETEELMLTDLPARARSSDEIDSNRSTVPSLNNFNGKASSTESFVHDVMPPESDQEDPIEYIEYQSELQMPQIMRLITKDLSEPYSIYTYRYFIHNWPKLCFLAMYRGECVGAIVCKLDFHKKHCKRGYIAMLAVAQGHRRKGIGSYLVIRAIKGMVTDNCDEVVLETEITNHAALHLYENLGFVRDKRLFRYYLNGVDALRLKLWLK